MTKPEHTPEIDVNVFMQENGINEVMAQRTIEAHGNTYTVAEAIALCPPFAMQIRSTVEALNDSVPDAALRATITENVLTRTIDSMAVRSADVEVTSDFLEPAPIEQ